MTRPNNIPPSGKRNWIGYAAMMLYRLTRFKRRRLIGCLVLLMLLAIGVVVGGCYAIYVVLV